MKKFATLFFAILVLLGCDKKESEENNTPSTNPNTFVDIRDNHVYSTVKIGNQIWMAENLAYLPSVTPSNHGSYTAPCYYVYYYSDTSVSSAKETYFYKTYGVLYNWPAAMAGEVSSNSVPSGVEGICPNGWHLPSDEEWKILEGEVDSFYGYPDPVWEGIWFRGTDAGANIKETGYTHWASPNTGATNSSGFSALPGSSHDLNQPFSGTGFFAFFWSSTEANSSEVWGRDLIFDYTNIGRGRFNKDGAFSIRCLKDN